jgi:hypothetical protein
MSMGYHHQAPAFTVSVEGAFVAPGLWLLHAEVEYRAGLGVEAQSRLRHEARCELMRGIIRESRRGWELRARRVRVLIEGDSEAAGFFKVMQRRHTHGRHRIRQLPEVRAGRGHERR